MTKNKPYQRGFVGGAYIAMMVVGVAVLGSILTVSSNTAKKLNVAQNVVNSQNTAEKLAAYLINNTARDLDGDGFLELPPQIDPLGSSRQSSDPAYDPEYPGLLPTIGAFDSLRRDANGVEFRICSANMGPSNAAPPPQYNFAFYFQYVTTTPADQNLDKNIFAVIGAGPDGKFEDNICSDLIRSPDPYINGDDKVRLITYAEVYNAQIQSRQAAVKDDIVQNPVDCNKPESRYFTPDNPYNSNYIYTLEFVPAHTAGVNDTDQAKWRCVPKFNALAGQYLPGCTAAERLSVVVDENGKYNYTCTSLEQVGNNAMENFDIAKMASSFCPRGYNFTGISAILRGPGGNGNIRNIQSLSIDCTRMASAGAEFGANAQSRTYVFSNTCAATPPAGKTMLIYLRRDGMAACTPVPVNTLKKTPTPVLPERDCAPTDINFYNQTGVICFAPDTNQLVNTKNICGINESLRYNSETRAIECVPSANSKKWVMPMRSDGSQCQTGDVIIYDSSVNGHICRAPQYVMDLVKPTAACTNTQMVSWDRVNKRFKCIQR